MRAIDQTILPHRFEVIDLHSLDDVCNAIINMQVRGAPLIGITAAYGMYLAAKDDSNSVVTARARLLAARPTAINLAWSLQQVDAVIHNRSSESLADEILNLANALAKEDIVTCEKIGNNGHSVINELWQKRSTSQDTLNVLTHCNAGWLATVDWGTALSSIYKACEKGIPVYVWVGETRPRNQGAFLSAWEL